MAAVDLSVLVATWPWKATVVAQTTSTTVSGPVVELRGSGAVVLVAVVGLAIALLWFVPLWIDARRAYRLREQAVQLVGGRLLDAAKKDNLTVSELRALLATIGEPATGQRGLSRALMAFTIITVVGVALLALLLSTAGDASDLRKTVITALLTLLGTIVGFYFGTRAAETGAELANPVPTPLGQATTPDGPISREEVRKGRKPDGVADEGTVPAAAGDGIPASEREAAAVTDGEQPATATDEEAVASAEEDTVPSTEEDATAVTDGEEPVAAAEEEASTAVEGEEFAAAAEGDELASSPEDGEPAAVAEAPSAPAAPRRRKSS